MLSHTTALLILGGFAAAAPQSMPPMAIPAITPNTPYPATYQWNIGAQTNFPIHSSCNATQRALLNRGLNDARILAQQARDHILLRGTGDAHYQKYFGNASSAEAAGWYDRIVNADKKVNWFRCDDPDKKCWQDGWAGYWRDANGTEETNICPLSFKARMPLEGLCGYGWDVANGKTNLFWASDLMHRMLHLPNIAQGVVDHFADGYKNVTELAKTRPEEASRNSETLQRFALDVYAFDISLPGEGCVGVLRSSAPSSAASASASTTMSTTMSPTSADAATGAACQTQSNGVVLCQPTPSSTSTKVTTSTQSASSSCHTHSDGVVHCD